MNKKMDREIEIAMRIYPTPTREAVINKISGQNQAEMFTRVRSLFVVS